MTDHATRFLGQVNRIPVLGPVLAGARVVVPTRYVALHLILGLVATAAIIGFIVIAEEVVAGRTIAAFDRAFADALRTNMSPRWPIPAWRSSRTSPWWVITSTWSPTLCSA